MPDWSLAQSDGQHAVGLGKTGATYAAGVLIGSPNQDKGAWVELLAALPFDVSGFLVQVFGGPSIGTFVYDVGVGASGSEVVLLPDWLISDPRSNQTGTTGYFPVRIRKGARVAARCAGDTSPGSGSSINMTFFSSGFAADPGFSRITRYGGSGAGGPSIDPGATINTKGTWTLVHGGPINPIRSLIVTAHLRNATQTTALWNLDIGVGGTTRILIPDLTLTVNVNSDQVNPNVLGPFPLSVPAGTSLYARAKCTTNDATDRLIDDLVIYGMD